MAGPFLGGVLLAFAFIGAILAAALIEDYWFRLFIILFILRYSRALGNYVGWALYTPNPRIRPGNYGDRWYTRKDVTVILPTVDPTGPDFKECIFSMLKSDPAAIVVVTAGRELKTQCERILGNLVASGATVPVYLSAVSEPNKRHQVTHAIKQVRTAITVLADDHVFWDTQFLEHIAGPFKDTSVGAVAPTKRVRRTSPGSWEWSSLVNFIACNYLERHNWELMASNGIDGGVFVVSGRTAAYRTDFLQSVDLLEEFCNEKFFFGLFGGSKGLAANDDNFLTRKLYKMNLRTVVYDDGFPEVETTLGDWPKFMSQLQRWARTTVRSNPVMVRDIGFMCRYPWTGVMVYIAALFNFALLWDGAILYAACRALNPFAVPFIVLSMLLSKVWKILPNLRAHPEDIRLLPVQIVFGYAHSFIKLWADLTFWNCEWSGRKLDEITPRGVEVGDISLGLLTQINAPEPWV